MRALDIPLPASRHIPGQNARPEASSLESIKRMASEQTSCAASQSNPAWLYGLRLFNAGYYWEAHEVLEQVWLNAAPNSRERHLVQAVIHLANGLLKEAMGRPNARKRLAKLSRAAFLAAFPSGEGILMGIDGKAALRATEQLAECRIGIQLSTRYEI